MRDKWKKLLSVFCMLVMVCTQIQAGTITADAASVKKITLNKKICVIKKGSKITLKATVLPKKTKVTWKSSNKKVATVTQKGVVAAKKNGKTTITAKAGTKKASCQVIVGTPVSKLTVNQSSLTIVEGGTAQLKTSVLPKKASLKTVTYTSQNRKIATVTSKGLVKGIKSGTTKIIVASKDGNKKTTVNVTVTANQNSNQNQNTQSQDQNSAENEKPNVQVQGISFASAEEYVQTGSTHTLKPVFAPANASNQNMDWTSENTAVATVDAKGVVTGVSSGDATITAKTKDGGFEARVLVHVGNISVVSTNETIEQALQDRSLNYLILKSTAAEKFIIPEGNYIGVTLVADIPAGELNNYGCFKSVIIDNIAANTMHEYAKGNTITLRCNQSHVVVENDATATVRVVTGASIAQIENKGVLTQLELTAECDVTISGTAKEIIPVSITSKVKLTTNQNLQVNAITKFEMKIRSGAENTVVSVNNRSSIPQISGLGMIPVTITDDGNVETIVSDNIGTDPDAVDVKFYGAVLDLSDQPIEGASVIIVPYQAGYDINNMETDPNKTELTTDAQGKYELNTIKTGNYILQVKKDGFTTIRENVVISSVSGDNYNNQTINLLPSSFEGKTGGVSGKIVESLKGQGLENMTVRVRANQNNLVDSYLYEAKTDENGNYQFENIPTGYYTIQILDQRPGIDGNSAYLTVFFNVLVEPDKVITGQNATLSTAILPAQMRFVLNWGDEASGAIADADSHLIGPDASGYGVFHTYFSQKDATYKDELYANLDIDDIDWEGPETTTIYKEIPGVYRFYVHDYTNKEAEVSEALGNSGVWVDVYSGSFLMATYHIPKQEGNLWHVCDYDSVSGKLTTVNEMSYHVYNNEYYDDYYNDSNIANIGMTEEEIAFRNVAGVLKKLDEYTKLLDVVSAEKLNAIILEYEKRFEQADTAEEYQNIYNEANTFSQKLEDSFQIIVKGDCVEEYSGIASTNKLDILLYLDKEKDYSIEFGEECTAVEVQKTDEQAVKAYKVTNKDGYVRIIHVYESIDTYALRPETVTLENQDMNGFQIGTYEMEVSNEYVYKDAIYIYGKDPQLTGTIKATMANGVEGVIGKDTETGFPTVTFTVGLTSRTYLVVYKQQIIPVLVDPDNEIYKVSSYDNYINIYGKNDRLGTDYSFEKMDGYTVEVDEDAIYEGGAYTELEVLVKDTQNEDSTRYYITYYALPKYCEVSYVNAENSYIDEDDWEEYEYLYGDIDQSSNKILLKGRSDTAPSEIQVENEYLSANSKVEYVSDKDYFAIITVTYDTIEEYNRTYYVYYEQQKLDNSSEE